MSDPPTLSDLPDLTEGTALPTQRHVPTIMQVAKFIAGAGFAIPIFLDPEAARATGLEGPVVPAEFKSAYLLAYLTRLAGREGRVLQLQSAFRRPDYHGDPIEIGGQITRVESSPEGREVQLELWIEQENGDRSVRSSAAVLLPD